MASSAAAPAARSELPDSSRFLAHGVDHNDFLRITARAGDWTGWLGAWVEAGAAHEALGQEALAHGRTRTAGEAFVRAALYFHFAKYLWLEDLERYRDATLRSVEALRRGMPLLDPSFERLELPFERGHIVASLRRPPGVARPPLVILVPGLDSTKEEFPLWEETFLRRGLATASLDGPGQGEAGFLLPIRHDYEVPVAALLDALDGRGDLDQTRVGIAGLGLGNYYAARAAAFEPRLRAVGVVGGPYTLKPHGERTLRKLMHSAHLDDEASARAYGARFTLEGVTSRLEQPYLVQHGRLDRAFPWQDAERKVREARRGELVIHEEGDSVCYTVDPVVKAYLADWLLEHLTTAA